MRVWMVAVILAGCAAPIGPVGPDETLPIHSPRDVYQLVGPETGAPHDARVFVAVCGATSNLYAYTTNVAGWTVEDELALRAVAIPNATSFAIVAFLPGPDGLEDAARWMGGSDAVDGHHENDVDRPRHIPDDLRVPVDPDGTVRLAIGCTGTGTVGYVLGEPAPQRPDYLDAVVASGVQAFLALGTDGLFANGIQLQPQTTNVGEVWSAVGGVKVTHDSPVPQAPDAVRVQTDTIEWTGGAGWTTLRCSHRGWSDHGTWTYDGDLHGDVRLHEGTMAEDVAALWFTQTFLFGTIDVRHVAEGDAEGRMRFQVQHLASSSVLWTTMCEGIHFGASLQDLFGVPGAHAWERARGLVE